VSPERNTSTRGPRLSVGIDFGTSNSAAAVVREGERLATVLPIDAAAEDPRLLRSVLFFPQDSRETLSGAEAIGRYLDAEEGRFIQSIKTFLPSATFERTLVRGRSWLLEDLVAAILRPVREAVEAAFGGKVESVVFGRPAVFSTDPRLDARAQARLVEAARRAGFPEPAFVIEPIAAALSYEEGLTRDELVLVADFGAGTSDFTLMQLGPTRAGRADRQGDIVASAGIYLGGDNFDAAIVEHLLLPYFGAGSTYMAFTDRTELPASLTRKLLYWNELSFLREKDTMDFLYRVHATSDRPEHVANLISLVEENLAYHLYRAVEAAKRTLSEADSASISFHRGDISIDETVRRGAFEAWMAPLLASLDATLQTVLQRADGREPDAVFLTGGTSKIPAVREVFAARFGADRIRSGDAFTSVVAGLGHAAHDRAAP
jgi:hypothetical chaperone protein